MSERTEAVPNRREFCRVDAYVPIEYRLVNPEERSIIKSRVSGEIMLADFTGMPPLENQQVEYLNHLNSKLDTIIRMLALQFEGFHVLPFKFVSLSGNGMRFSSKQVFSCGDVLEFKMILNLYQPVALYVYGEVTRVEKQTDGHIINTCFTAIEDMIRDKIIRFVFEMERDMLRDRK